MRHVLVAAVLVTASVACGGSGDGDGDGEKTSPTAAPSGAASRPVALAGTVNDHGVKDVSLSTEAEIELDDFYFGPTFVRAAPTAALALKLRNDGDVVHTFTVTGLDVDVTVQPGATADAQLTLPASGAVRFFCRFHEAQGMQGAFYFNPGDAVAPGSGGPAPSSAAGGDGAYGQ